MWARAMTHVQETIGAVTAVKALTNADANDFLHFLESGEMPASKLRQELPGIHIIGSLSSGLPIEKCLYRQ